jgi:hypothetical protein
VTEKPKKSVKKTLQLQTAGWREWVHLPDLGLTDIKAKLDTGANYATLHALDITPFDKDGTLWVRFIVHPTQYNKKHRIICEAEVVEKRVIKSSSGQPQERYVVRTTLTMGDKNWPIELTLTNRTGMRYRMLLGRLALKRRFLVCSGRSYLLKHPTVPSKKEEAA